MGGEIKLNDSQRQALEVMNTRPDKFPWCHVENGVDGRSANALVRRGLAESRWAKGRWGYCIEFRITDEGREWLEGNEGP